MQFSKEEEVCAVVCISTRSDLWEKITKEFITSFMISDDFGTSYVTLPVSSLGKPMFVHGDYRSTKNKYFCALQKRNWARYFSDKVKQFDMITM